MQIVITNGIGIASNAGVRAVLASRLHLIRGAHATARILVIPWCAKTPALDASFKSLVGNSTGPDLIDPLLPSPLSRATSSPTPKPHSRCYRPMGLLFGMIIRLTLYPGVFVYLNGPARIWHRPILEIVGTGLAIYTKQDILSQNGKSNGGDT
jgi:hypothetical protein